MVVSNDKKVELNTAIVYNTSILGEIKNNEKVHN